MMKFYIKIKDKLPRLTDDPPPSLGGPRLRTMVAGNVLLYFSEIIELGLPKSNGRIASQVNASKSGIHKPGMTRSQLNLTFNLTFNSCRLRIYPWFLRSTIKNNNYLFFNAFFIGKM